LLIEVMDRYTSQNDIMKSWVEPNFNLQKMDI